MTIILGFIALIAAGTFLFLRHPQFGRIPLGERLEMILKSPNFRNGIFQNLKETPQLADDAGFFKMMSDHFSATGRRPVKPLPSVYTDLRSLAPDEDVLVWFGHSSYFIQLNGKKILVDPVFSGSASPFPFFVKSFPGTDRYTANDIPDPDYLVITHDHWDHLDYRTVKKLKNRTKHVVTGLGTGEHFERWGFDKNRIIELDWYQSVEPDKGFVFTATPARHFSGRGFRHKRTLWTSFALQTPTMKIFIGGDGGYDDHFKDIGDLFGGFDLAILENGQYNKSWKFIHMMPEQAVQAAEDLQANRLFPVHSSKFALAIHPWDEPLKRISTAANKSGTPLLTPVIGEKVLLNDYTRKFKPWWEYVSDSLKENTKQVNVGEMHRK